MRPVVGPPRFLPSFTVPRMSNDDLLSVMTLAVSYESKNMLDPNSLARFQPGNPYLYPVLRHVEEAEVMLVARSPTSAISPLQHRIDRIVDSDLISEFDLDDFLGDEGWRDLVPDGPFESLRTPALGENLPAMSPTEYEYRQNPPRPEAWIGNVADSGVTSGAVRVADTGPPMSDSDESNIDSLSTRASARIQAVAANLLDLHWEMDRNNDPLLEEDLAAIQAIMNELEPLLGGSDAIFGDEYDSDSSSQY